MASITIWALESENDAKVVKILAGKIAEHYQLQDIFFRAVSKVPKARKHSLETAVKLYLQQDNCVIFVLDTDGPRASHQRLQEPNSLINQVNRVLQSNQFSGRVFLAKAVPELEAWLLADCEGIICYFATKRSAYKKLSRHEIVGRPSFQKLAKKFQKGNTELIVEAEIGGAGAKEYMVRFSREILLAINPKMPSKNIKIERYQEKQSPDIASHIRVDEQILARNTSFRRFGESIARCCGPIN